MRRPILVSRRRLSASRSRVGVALAALALVSIGCSASPSTDSASEASTFSLLATGDTGKQHRFAASLFEGQLAVSQAMAVEDQRQALDAVLLLGDNFYAEGLRRSELVPRIRQNIVRPYCRFLALDGPRSDEVRDACPLSAAERHPIPLYAVLGNHDVVAPESAELQSHTVPEFVPNWSLDASFGRVVEFPQGVSLILLNSDIYKPFDRPAKLTALLRQARGRWRIVAAHRPATVDEFGGKSPVTAALRADLHAATARAQAPVHVFLSGHQHSLQLLASTSPDPYLAVIVGSGARHRPIRAPHPDRVFGLDALGFARIDLRGEGDNERLVVTLFATADFPVLGMEAERVASWSVDRSGRTRNEF